MQNRRKLIRNSTGLIAGSFMMPAFASSFFKSSYPPPGIQLFTFFDMIDKDVEGTLKRIAQTGYVEIESAFSKKGGYYGNTPKQFSALLTGMGLTWKSHHVLGAPFKLPPGAKMPMGSDGKPMTIPPMHTLRDNMQEIIDEVSEGGVEWLVCANTPTNTLNEIHSSIEVLNRTDEACKKAGLHFAYHNHDAEFHDVEGKIPYQMLLSEGTMKMELDLAWPIKGGQDPVDLFNKNPGRFPLWHVKDLDSTRENILPVGSGTIDFKRIFAASETAGLKNYFVEHDMPKDAWDSIQKSLVTLKELAPVS
ncbi:MAG: sugar phosphate isomerase/epimerase [Bacteroidota bacterium]|nr:sugar phosphate isomerase/epimerase [Bacteroidota bacterium]